MVGKGSPPSSWVSDGLIIYLIQETVLKVYRQYRLRSYCCDGREQWQLYSYPSLLLAFLDRQIDHFLAQCNSSI
jgi:hypothetical protein